MKTLILGDIHGRGIWRRIIEKEVPDQTVFLGDYVSTHESYGSQQQLDNLNEILAYKAEHPSTVMLRGNHDLQHLGYPWAECSGWDSRVHRGMLPIKDQFLASTQWLYLLPGTNILCSHAGVSADWLAQKARISPDDPEWIDKVNALQPQEIFGFIQDCPDDFYGFCPTQPPTWIRPQTLLGCAVPGYTQIVGHTPTQGEPFDALEKQKADPYWRRAYGEVPADAPTAPNIGLWCNDSLGSRGYIVVEDGVIVPKSLPFEPIAF